MPPELGLRSDVSGILEAHEDDGLDGVSAATNNWSTGFVTDRRMLRI